MELGEKEHQRKRHRPHHHGLHHDRPQPRDHAAASTNNPFMPMFLAFRDELDQHHDRRERIIKASRDITALSKKMIFSLQRFPLPSPSLPSFHFPGLVAAAATSRVPQS